MVQLTTILAIDPGFEQSAWLLRSDHYSAVTGLPVLAFDIQPNERLLDDIRHGAFSSAAVIVIEKIESYGMPVGAEVFETVRWSGRFEEAALPTPVVYLPRRAVKLHLCGSARAKDANVHQALIDRFGGKSAKGVKAHPGPLYGVSKDVWSALAIAVTYAETVAL